MTGTKPLAATDPGGADRVDALPSEVVDLGERRDARQFALAVAAVMAGAAAAEAECKARLAGQRGSARRGHLRAVDGGRPS